MDLKKLKEASKTLDPVLRIGKNGLNDNIFTEVEKLLKTRKLIKIKILNNCPLEDKNEIIDKIIEKSQASLITKIGNVFTIYRLGKKKAEK